MRKIFYTILFVTFSLSLTAQFSAAAKDSAKTEILQLTANWNKAIINRDSLALDRILASGYSLNGSVNRSTWINNTMHHITTDTLMTLEQPLISFYGNAVKAEASFFWKASLDGKPVINAEYTVTDIWIRQNNQWQVLIRLSSLSKKR